MALECSLARARTAATSARLRVATVLAIRDHIMRHYWHNEPPTLKRCPQGLLSFFEYLVGRLTADTLINANLMERQRSIAPA
ncbi:MAG: hypothetical protein ACLUKN_03715 [Bacilli bacterium]